MRHRPEGAGCVGWAVQVWTTYQVTCRPNDVHTWPGTEPCCAGMLACWNHPFEVARIEAQARGDQNQKDLNMVQIFRMIVKEQVIHRILNLRRARICRCALHIEKIPICSCQVLYSGWLLHNAGGPACTCSELHDTHVCPCRQIGNLDAATDHTTWGCDVAGCLCRVPRASSKACFQECFWASGRPCSWSQAPSWYKMRCWTCKAARVLTSSGAATMSAVGLWAERTSHPPDSATVALCAGLDMNHLII